MKKFRTKEIHLVYRPFDKIYLSGARWLLIAAKLSGLITCSMRHASEVAVSGSTPRLVSQEDKNS